MSILCKWFGHKWKPRRYSPWTVFNAISRCARCEAAELHYIDFSNGWPADLAQQANEYRDDSK
jgi:hypothetical protein